MDSRLSDYRLPPCPAWLTAAADKTFATVYFKVRWLFNLQGSHAPRNPGKILEFHFESSRSGNILEFCEKPWNFQQNPWKKCCQSTWHYFGGILCTTCLKCSFPQKSMPTKLLKGSSIFSIKALENVKNVLKNTLEKSLNFSNAKVWEPWCHYVADQPKSQGWGVDIRITVFTLYIQNI